MPATLNKNTYMLLGNLNVSYNTFMTLLIVSFIAGVLTVLAPCILPLLPVILAGSITETKNRRRPFIIIASLSVSVFLFTLILKGSTALIDVSPSFWTYVSALILAAFGLTLLFPITWAKLVLKIPGHNKPDSWISKGYGETSSVWTDIIVGAALGPVFTTCSPTFFVILATVLPQSLAMGLIDLAAYIIGLALVLLLIALIGQRLVDHLEWATNPMGWFKRCLGILFIVLAVLIAFGADKKIESAILNSGFFDVTTLEQSIHQSLEGQSKLPNNNQSADNLSASTSVSVLHGSNNQKPNTNNQILTAIPSLPPGVKVPVDNDEGKYIEIKNPADFVNSAPFHLADYVGKKVILIDFIDYSCINCERTFPFLNDWYAKYKDQGFIVVAIHTPEFSFEKIKSNVQMAADMFGLKFPIVMDNDYSTWNAYGNEYWPHKYLIDIHGRVVYDHIGEGNDDVTEGKIVELLNKRKLFLNEQGVVTYGKSAVAEQTIQTESPETYFGALRNEYFGNGDQGVTGTNTYTIPQTLTPNKFYLGGAWNIQNEYAQTAGSTGSPQAADMTDSPQHTSSQLSYIFTASKMYIIASLADGSSMTSATAQVLIDGKPIPAQWVGSDVSGTAILKIDQSRLYSLYSNPVMGRHRIDIIFNKPGVRVFTFTFG